MSPLDGAAAATWAADRIVHDPPCATPPPRLSLVLPTRNEAANIERVLDAVLSLPTSACIHELWVVDDGHDATAELALGWARKDERVRVLKRNGRNGLACAILDGWAQTSGDWLGVMDADGQHPAALLPHLCAALASGADIAIASRNASGGSTADWTRMRRRLSAMAQWCGRVCAPRAFGACTDPLSGFFLIKRSAMPVLPHAPLGYKLLLELLTHAPAARTVEVPFQFGRRIDGQSKLGLRVVIDYLRQLRRLVRAH